MTADIRIYVADLAAYNNGYLHGVWIDATSETSDIQEQINRMLKASPIAGAEEYAIHDYEGYGSYRLHEYAGIQTAHDVALFIEEYPDFGSALLDHCGDLDEARTIAEDGYCGCYSSLAAYAEEMTEDVTQIPENLRYYINCDAMARDMELNGDVFTIETGYQRVHIFWNR